MVRRFLRRAARARRGLGHDRAGAGPPRRQDWRGRRGGDRPAHLHRVGRRGCRRRRDAGVRDVDDRSGTLDPALFEHAITPRTKAVMPVHLYGHPAAMDDINAIASAHGLLVVEDAAQAHGARYKGRRVGSLSTIACFSFYPTKNLGAFGDAGLVTTTDAGLAAGDRGCCAIMAASASTSTRSIGQTARLDNLQAAILRIAGRTAWTSGTRAGVRWPRGIGNISPAYPWPCRSRRDGAEPVYHLFVVRTPERDRLRDHLAARGVAWPCTIPSPSTCNRRVATWVIVRGICPCPSERPPKCSRSRCIHSSMRRP